MPPPVISPGTPARCCGPDNARGHRRLSVASARSAPRRSRRFADFARPCSPAYPADKSPQCALLCYSGQAGRQSRAHPLASSGLIGDKPARRQHGADQRSGDPIVHHPLQQLPLRTGAQTLAGQQLAQGRGHAGRGSGVAGVAGKRLIQFRFPAVKAGDVVADLAQKAVNPAGPPTVASSRLAALLSLMVMAAAQSSPTVMPSARCFSLTGE